MKTPQEIVAFVEKQFNLSPGQIYEHDQSRPLPRARKIVSYVLRDMGLFTKEIGRLLKMNPSRVSQYTSVRLNQEDHDLYFIALKFAKS